MLQQLARGDACVSDLGLGHDMSLQAISKHVRVLERAGLVSRRREGRHSWLSLRTPPLEQAKHWIERWQRSWAQPLDALESLLERD
jgi:DNA-binding transcriptional ArsR family regulator